MRTMHGLVWSVWMVGCTGGGGSSSETTTTDTGSETSTLPTTEDNATTTAGTTPTDSGSVATDPGVELGATVVDDRLEEVGLCDPTRPDTVDLLLSFDGEASRANLDIADTAGPYPWNEVHELLGDAATGSTLVREGLPTGVMPSDWASGVATVFHCDQFEDPSTMSYIARIYDEAGELLDCVAWGHDPQGMVDGVYFDNNATEDEEELQGCRIRSDG